MCILKPRYGVLWTLVVCVTWVCEHCTVAIYYIYCDPRYVIWNFRHHHWIISCYKFQSSCLNVSFLQRCPRANVALYRSLEGKHLLCEGKTCSCLWHWNTKIKKVNVIHFKTALFCERMNPEAKIQNKLCYSIWLFSNFTTNSRLCEYITSYIVEKVNSYIAVFIHL